MERELILGFVMLVAIVGGSANAASSISLPTYAKRADAVCFDYRWKASQLLPPAPSAFAKEVALARTLHAIVVYDNKTLHAIPLPNTKRTVVRDWLAAKDRVPGLIDKFRIAAETKNLTLVEEANAVLVANGATGRLLARQLGMKVCAQV